MCQGNGKVIAAHPFVLFYRKTDCILKEQIMQYFLIRENLQDQSTHKSKKL